MESIRHPVLKTIQGRGKKFEGQDLRLPPAGTVSEPLYVHGRYIGGLPDHQKLEY